MNHLDSEEEGIHPYSVRIFTGFLYNFQFHSTLVKCIIGPLLEEERDLLVGHLTLKDPLVVQVILLTRIRERGATRTVHVMNLRRQCLLSSMVR